MTLRGELTKLINQSHADTWTRFDWVRENSALYGVPRKTSQRWNTPGEPAFVSNLLEYPFLQFGLRNLIHEHLRPVGLCAGAPLVSGVFIHQKPKVCFGPSQSQVELGDLLLVRHHFQSGVPSPEGRAFLVQAKSAEKPHTGNLAGKEAHQFALYANWATPFRFPHGQLGPAPGGAKRWDFSTSPIPQLSSTGVYGIVAKSRSQAISSTFPAGCTWAIGTATPCAMGASPSVDASGMSLAEALEGFLRGSWGRPWNAVPADDDHWSTFIHRCLLAAATWRGYPLQRLGAPAISRRRDALAYVAAFASAPTEISPTGPLQHRLRDMHWLLVNDDQRQAVEASVHAWAASVNMTNAGELPPEPSHKLQGMPSGGMSVLYVATFGDGALQESQPLAPAPAADSEPPPGWGDW